MTQSENGYLSIHRTWETGDQVDIRLPMNLHTYIAKDNPTKQALLYGPLVLAGKLGKENYPESDILADHMSLDNQDRKSTRLNSSHVAISYAVFCLKKKTKYNNKKHISTM